MLDDILLAYKVREEHVGTELMREMERQILLQTIDSKWVDYLHNIDLLREGIHLRGYGQRDPLKSISVKPLICLINFCAVYSKMPSA